jgi:hypothetical protein
VVPAAAGQHPWVHGHTWKMHCRMSWTIPLYASACSYDVFRAIKEGRVMIGGHTPRGFLYTPHVREELCWLELNAKPCISHAQRFRVHAPDKHGFKVVSAAHDTQKACVSLPPAYLRCLPPHTES